MFTGIVEGLGTVADVRNRGSSLELTLDMGSLAEGVATGDSVAVSGVCLTATLIEGPRVSFDVVRETLDKTSLSAARRGHRFNVERALRLGDRLGGHLVQGHVDGTGVLEALDPEPGQTRLVVGFEPAMERSLLLKGSVAIDGISLTIATLDRNRFSVAIVPHTLENTNLADRRPGDRVNLELDMVGKWVRRLVDEVAGERGPGEGKPGGIDLGKLAEGGFLPDHPSSS